MTAMDAEWWRQEARKSAEDGHPAAAVAAMANALLGPLLAQDADEARRICPQEWAQLVTYADALGVVLPG
jgi:hypothetical protein